ncbi:VOC family protein [Actinorugispora endophytica]|uniref:Putative enzyme related to lactoylglutathione lyase n=1 Tax=Actinorugispora endophytica TaxID=1605990 RepID=A0A4R6V4F6_9ACTN|nr:VOC family protein [Actinorugispora endophytica]TDQ55295.1 putative enzyme related to lactoylglutathione lyase [Actinorugispora endophytica]
MRMSYVRLLADDYEACFRFYADVLKFPVLRGSEETRYAEFEVGSETLLALNQREVVAEALGTDAEDPHLPRQDRIAVIFEVEDVDAKAAELIEAGVPMVSPAKEWTAWGIRAAHFRDPDGYLLEINQQVPVGAAPPIKRSLAAYDH